MRVRALSTLVAAGVILATPYVLTTTASAQPSSAAVAPGTFSTTHRTVHRSPSTSPVVTAIRVGHHAGFDRVVIQLRGRTPGFDVKYVTNLHADPSDKVVNLLGPASLQFIVTPAAGFNPTNGHSTLTTPERTKWRLDQVRETAVIGDFEGVFTLGVGLARKAPFRVLTLQNPTRIVVDIRH
jgi:hypothetical protein